MNREVNVRRAAADPDVRDLLGDALFTEGQLPSAWPVEAGLRLPIVWGTPHALQVLAPDDAVVVPWAEVAGALVSDSPLRRLLPQAP